MKSSEEGSARQEQIKIHSWEDDVYKVSSYPDDASKAQLTRPIPLLSSMCHPLLGKSLSLPERVDSMKAPSKSLKGLEKPRESTARCQSVFIIALGLGWG